MVDSSGVDFHQGLARGRPERRSAERRTTQSARQRMRTRTSLRAERRSDGVVKATFAAVLSDARGFLEIGDLRPRGRHQAQVPSNIDFDVVDLKVGRFQATTMAKRMRSLDCKVSHRTACKQQLTQPAVKLRRDGTPVTADLRAARPARAGGDGSWNQRCAAPSAATPMPLPRRSSRRPAGARHGAADGGAERQGRPDGISGTSRWKARRRWSALPPAAPKGARDRHSLLAAACGSRPAERATHRWRGGAWSKRTAIDATVEGDVGYLSNATCA